MSLFLYDYDYIVIAFRLTVVQIYYRNIISSRY